MLSPMTYALCVACGSHVPDSRGEVGISQEMLGEFAVDHQAETGDGENGRSRPSLPTVAGVAGAHGVDPVIVLMNLLAHRPAAEPDDPQGPDQ